jgi:hypothetical protein
MLKLPPGVYEITDIDIEIKVANIRKDNLVMESKRITDKFYLKIKEA